MPVNPDFVPWAHELIYHLAGASASHQCGAARRADRDRPRSRPAGRVADLARSRRPAEHPPQAAVVRFRGKTQARLDDTGEPGVYQFRLPDPPGGSAFATVAADGRESDFAPLEPASAEALARDVAVTLRDLTVTALAGWLFAAGPASRHEIWRYLVLGTLAGLCMEVWLTRRMVKNSGMADLRAARGDAPSTEEPNRRWSHSP